MDEREAERQVGPATLDQRHALAIAPPDRGRRVGEIDDEGQDHSLPSPSSAEYRESTTVRSESMATVNAASFAAMRE